MLVYSNNGEKSKEALSNPRVPSGVLAEWDGKSDTRTIVRRNQFVEVTGTGGIEGNPKPATDPIGATGWDNKSVILALREPDTGWSYYRLPKGEIAAAQSQSNLWFVKPEKIDALGPAIGRAWFGKKRTWPPPPPSDPLLFNGYDRRCLHVSHSNSEPVPILLEVDPAGTGEWKPMREISAMPYTYVSFDKAHAGVWIWLRAKESVKGNTAAFSYRNEDRRAIGPDPMFDGLAKPGQPLTGGIVRARDGNASTMAFAATDASGEPIGYNELDETLKLKPVAKDGEPAWTNQHAAIPKNDFLVIDEGSVLLLDQDGTRWRLPKGGIGRHPLGDYRVAREIVTERDIFNTDGTIYELPARNAGGFIKVRPVATHKRLIHDLGGFRGLLVMSGVAKDAPASNKHILRSTDGKTAVWAGAIDDLWKLGKPLRHRRAME